MEGLTRRSVAVLTVTLFVISSAAVPAPAMAVEPPRVPPGPIPVGPVAPLVPTEQKVACGVGAVFPGSRFDQRPTADVILDYSGAWHFSRGVGQKVAVIDTGVSPNPRLRELEGGGDYVSTSDGLADCDVHGTLVAGLIAASPSPDDAFAGVAPDAAILSIRQNSGAYSAQGANPTQGDPNALSSGYGNTQTLALAIIRAVDLGATVINLSEAACAPVSARMDDTGVGLALRYAFERNVVAVAAAGNVASSGLCSTQNDVSDPNLPLADAWSSVQTIASPAWFEDYVLTVGAVTPDATPADFSLHGPWVDVAAPGEGLTSLTPNGTGLMNAWSDQRGPMPINGTSFAAPLVAGVVALIRSRFPDMSAGEVMERVKRTARTAGAGPNAATGYGVVDPVAALTYQVPPLVGRAPNSDGLPIPAALGETADSRVQRHVTWSVLAMCAVLSLVAVTIAKNPRARRRLDVTGRSEGRPETNNQRE